MSYTTYNNPEFYDENDEMSDDEYYSTSSTIIIKKDEDDDLEPIDEEDDIIITDMSPDIFQDTKSEYKVTAFTPAFLRVECNIKLENYKTVCKFKYRDDIYKGIVIQKWPHDEESWVFLVENVDKKKDNQGKHLKKIYIPDASLISAIVK